MQRTSFSAIAAAFIGLLFCIPLHARADSFVFERIVDSNTPIPDGSKTFKQFRKPSIDAEGEIAFKAKGNSGQRGIYTEIGGNLAVVADRNTAIPGGAGNFSLFGIPSIDSGHVAFTGSGDDQGGLFTRPSEDRLRRSSHWAIRLLERQ